MGSDYLCWRITGELVNSIDGCPFGTLDDCMLLAEGETCPGGREVVI